MSTVRYVALVLDRYDGSGNPYVTGQAALTPSMEMPDPADQMLVGQAPISAVFRSGPLPSRMLAATDSIGPQSNAWTWNVTYTSVPGSPASASYYLPAGPAAFTATDATPCVFTWTPTASLTTLPNGTGVQLSGSPPAGFTAGTTYYVVNVSGSTLELAATQGGSPIASTGTGSGNLTVVQYNLSALASTPAGQPGQQYLPLPSGTPSSGQVPVASGSGQASAWTTLTAASVSALALTGGTLTGPLVINDVPAGAPSGLPVGYGDSTALTGLQVASSYPGDDISDGTDGTGRINLYSYQRANVNSFGETIRNFLMRWDAKAMHAWYGPVSLYDGSGNAITTDGWKPWTWAGSHYESNADNAIHGHWEIEVPDSTGAMQGRFEIPFIDSNPASGTYGTVGVDVTNIMTNQAYLTVNSQWGALRIASPAATVPRVIEFANSIYTGTEYAAATSSARWQAGANAAAESGSNAGSNFSILRYNDSASLLGTPLAISRATGLTTLSSLAVPGLIPTSAAPVAALAQTIPLYMLNTSAGQTVASGQMFLYAVDLQAGQTVSNITFLLGSTSATGVTHAWFSLIADGTWTQLAHSADQTSGSLTASQFATKAMATPYLIPSTGKYWLALVVVATQQPTLAGSSTIVEGGTAFAVFPLAGAGTTGLTAPGTDGTTTYEGPTSSGDGAYAYPS